MAKKKHSSAWLTLLARAYRDRACANSLDGKRFKVYDQREGGLRLLHGVKFDDDGLPFETPTLRMIVQDALKDIE